MIQKKATKKGKTKDPLYECSADLKRTFIQLSDAWCKANRLTLADLSERCGVSHQYLSQVARYGRIPSKPILTLLALNLDVPDPNQFFRMAKITEPWPYERDLGLRKRSATESGLLSINLDMNGFASAIREIVRSEIQPKRLDALLTGRPLRIGLNRGQFFLFGKSDSDGFITEVFRSLALSLHCEVEFIDVSHATYASELASGKIDLYGPLYKTTQRASSGLFGTPLCRVAPALLRRTRVLSNLPQISAPKSFSELRKKEYIIAVHEDSMAHHFLVAELGVPKSRIVPCELAEEAIERIVMTNIPRPAHLMVTDMPFAQRTVRAHPDTVELVESVEDSQSFSFVDTFVVRHDWPSLLPIVEQSFEVLRSNETLKRIFFRTIQSPDTLGINLL